MKRVYERRGPLCAEGCTYKGREGGIYRVYLPGCITGVYTRVYLPGCITVVYTRVYLSGCIMVVYQGVPLRVYRVGIPGCTYLPENSGIYASLASLPT